MTEQTTRALAEPTTEQHHEGEAEAMNHQTIHGALIQGTPTVVDGREWQLAAHCQCYAGQCGTCVPPPYDGADGADVLQVVLAVADVTPHGAAIQGAPMMVDGQQPTLAPQCHCYGGQVCGICTPSYKGTAGEDVLHIVLNHSMDGMTEEWPVNEASGERAQVCRADGYVMDHRIPWWNSTWGRPTRNRIGLVLSITSASSAWRTENFVANWAKLSRIHDMEERAEKRLRAADWDGELWARDIEAEHREDQRVALYQDSVAALPRWLAAMARSTLGQAEWLINGPVGTALFTIMGHCTIGEGGIAHDEANARWAVARLYNYRSMPFVQPRVQVTNAQLDCAERILGGISDGTTMHDFARFIYHIMYSHSMTLIKGCFCWY